MKFRACQAGATSQLHFERSFVSPFDGIKRTRAAKVGCADSASKRMTLLPTAATAIARSHTIVGRPSRRFALAIRFALGGR
jgi:hypothetical protein